MSDDWIGIDESSISGHSNCYSDEIDSDAQAELYSLIHYQEHLGHVNYFTGECTPESSKMLNVGEIRETSFILHENFQADTDKLLILSAQNNANSDTKEQLNKGDLLEQGENSCSIPLKRKSDSEHSAILCVDDSTAKDLSEQASSVNSKNVWNSSSSKNPYSLQEKEVIVIDSSDNDSSIIWTEPECSEKNIGANVFNIIDTVSVDSDSSNNLLIISSPLRENNFLMHSLSVPNAEADKHCKDLWYVNNEDLYRTKKRLKHYRKKKSLQCYKCYKKGHASKMCPVPHVVKCFICGGNHVGTKCKRRICNKCFKSGHDGINCCKIYPGVCCLCRMKGHSEIDCPDIWRRYHLTTQPSSIVQGMLKMKQNRTFYCFNCGMPGHFGALCKHSRIKGSLQTWPAVLSYDNPEALLRGRLNNITNVNDFKNDVIITNFETDAILNVNGQLRASQNNAKSNKQKLEHSSINNANPKRRKLNVSQGFASQGKNAQEKYASCEIQPKQTANAVRKKDFLKTRENARTFQIIDLTEDPVPESMNHSHENKYLREPPVQIRRILFQNDN